MPATEQLAAALTELLGTPVDAGSLQRLSGGASRETWSFRSNGRELILRRDPPGRPGPAGSMRREADAMQACRRAGLPVPEVLVVDEDGRLGTAALVMGRVPGESLPRRILREEEYRSARDVLVAQLGEFLAGLHTIDVAEVPAIKEADEFENYRAAYDMLPDHSTTFEKAFEWLEANRPSRAVPTLVHGDLRLGNLIVDGSGLAAVIDWEFVHLGDPVEDLAWLSVKAWRFGERAEVGGLGSLDELVDAYETAGGPPVDRGTYRWWLVQKTLQWGVVCMAQAWAHLSGMVRSHELAAIGRRVAEQEWDLLELLAPAEWAAARDAPLAEAQEDTPGLHGRPTAREMLDAVRGYLLDDVVPGTSSRLSYHAKVAANMLAIVERELAQPAVEHSGEDWASLALAVRDKLVVANPGHLRT